MKKGRFLFLLGIIVASTLAISPAARKEPPYARKSRQANPPPTAAGQERRPKILRLTAGDYTVSVSSNGAITAVEKKAGGALKSSGPDTAGEIILKDRTFPLTKPAVVEEKADGLHFLYEVASTSILRVELVYRVTQTGKSVGLVREINLTSPRAWSYGTFPNFRNVLWSCNWEPVTHWDYTEFGVRNYQTAVAISNGWGDYCGFAATSIATGSSKPLRAETAGLSSSRTVPALGGTPSIAGTKMATPMP